MQASDSNDDPVPRWMNYSRFWSKIRNRMDLGRMNYARLTFLLSNAMDLDELLALGSRLGVSHEQLELGNNPTIMELVINLVALLRKEHRVHELFDTFYQLHPDVVDEWWRNRPTEEWDWPQLAEHIISKVDDLLGDTGEMYYGGETYPTGCYCWTFASPIARGNFPELKYRILNRLRAKLSDEPVIVYIGEYLLYIGEHEYRHPCLVVAPTTDQFDILRIEGTNEPNLYIETGDVLDELLLIDEKFGLDIVGATGLSVTFKLKRIAKDIEY
ncbi:MAG: hypothetical protein L0322_25655, partial [Chloroflexi bacterium]|nr:hypothetical protein [Chloroflexota bacterium]